nr:XRE family transcriptional regulator [Kineococcus aurantiacus]
MRWARETARIDQQTAAARLGVKLNRVEQWEAGQATPTLNQLRKMSDVYERPLAAFFMRELPDVPEPSRLPDFRRSETREGIDPAPLQKAISRAYRQRDALIDILEATDGNAESGYAAFELDPESSAEEISVELRTALDLDSIPRATVLRPEEYARTLIRRAEALGITVIQTQRVDARLMRGFSIADGPCPIIALNGADWPRGKIYTLIHELAHVGFRTSGLCDLQHEDDGDLERKCEQIAAATLMPKDQFLSLIDLPDSRALDTDTARAIGSQFGVSGEAAVLRTIELGLAEWDDYWRLKPEFDAAYRAFRTEQREAREGKDPPPIFYQLKARDLGRRFITRVVEAHRDEAISSRDVSQLLEVSYDKVPKLLSVIGEAPA